MNRQIHYEITEYQTSILLFLREMQYPKGILTALKNTPHTVLKNGKDALLREELNPKDTLDILIVDEEYSKHIEPIAMPLSIIYEDDDILVVNKSSGIPIHPSINHHTDTLANGLMDYYQKQNIPFVFRCMNRLDRDTSGLTLLAKNPLSAALLNTQVKNKQLQRTYLCIASGKPHGSGTIDAPIGRLEGSTIERCVDFINGKSAITHYHVLDELCDDMLPKTMIPSHQSNGKALSIKNGFSLVSLQLETGRTHQIRVHMRHIGHPLPGDFLYNPDMTFIQRQALHSYRLEFIHPITKVAMSLTAPLPADMLTFLA